MGISEWHSVRITHIFIFDKRIMQSLQQSTVRHSMSQKAITKDQANGIVFINQDLCIGCGKCAKACPYHAPVVDRRVKKALKCDTCFDLRKNNDLPACVASCSMRCLSFYSGENYEDITNQILYDHECIDSSSLVFPGQNALLPNPDLTEPNLFITPHRNDNGLTSDDIVSHDN